MIFYLINIFTLKGVIYCEKNKSKISRCQYQNSKRKRKKNLFYYELRDDEGTSYRIEQSVIINNIGSLIIDKDILGNKKYIMDKDLDNFDLEETQEFF